jgi:hypothetical protein
MTEIKRIAVDTSKSVFTLHGVDDAAERCCGAICGGVSC